MNLRSPTVEMFELSDVCAASEIFAAAGPDERGAVFTRREVVDLVLDLAGYTERINLAAARLLEPAAGHGDFLLPAIERLIRSYVEHGGRLDHAEVALADSILAYEVHESSLTAARAAVQSLLRSSGLSVKASKSLAERWVVLGDFLLTSLPRAFSHVVGNPPYVRQELIPEPLLRLYRQLFETLYDRADLYVLFFEKCLNALTPNGRLGFICADRWTKNRYGGPLREMVSQRFALTHYVDLVDTPAFLSEVDAYPAITVIERPIDNERKPRLTRVAYRPTISQTHLRKLTRSMLAKNVRPGGGVFEMEGVVNGSEPWILSDPIRLRLVRRLEATFPTLEGAGCKVGIGVATGADEVYIGRFDEMDVEPSRKVPLARSQDIMSGMVSWQGMGVINPFEADGGLADFKKYPRFARYMKEHAGTLMKRNVARRNSLGWYRTIDRIYPELANMPKLLIPDIKGSAHVVYEGGHLYPHHNLYVITTQDWDLRALQAVLLSGIAKLFVSTYSTAMRGGFLRFQAQYLRRIRVPHWTSIPPSLRRTLVSAGTRGDARRAAEATFRLYELSDAERALLADQ